MPSICRAIRLSSETETKKSQAKNECRRPCLRYSIPRLFPIRMSRIRLPLAAGELPRPPVCNPYGYIPDVHQFALDARLPTVVNIPHRAPTANPVCDFPRVLIPISQWYFASLLLHEDFRPREKCYNCFRGVWTLYQGSLILSHLTGFHLPLVRRRSRRGTGAASAAVKQ